MWNGPCDRRRLEEWLSCAPFQLPEDLLGLWLEFGGGTIFETEEIFAPFGESTIDRTFDEANGFHRTAGLQDGYWVFHEGAWLSAVRRHQPQFVTLERKTYRVTAEYGSLAEWYLRTIRGEYAERYGLEAVTE